MNPILYVAFVFYVSVFSCLSAVAVVMALVAFELQWECPEAPCMRNWLGLMGTFSLFAIATVFVLRKHSVPCVLAYATYSTVLISSSVKLYAFDVFTTDCNKTLWTTSIVYLTNCWIFFVASGIFVIFMYLTRRNDQFPEVVITKE